MINLINAYKKQFNLQRSEFLRIAHKDAMVALVFKIIQPTGEEFILKICDQPNHYLREVYFLKYFADKIPVPKIIDWVEPNKSIHGAILMECLPGSILEIQDLDSSLAYQAGALLAQIHQNCTIEYGDLIKPAELTSDPRISFTEKFVEGLEECENHQPKKLIECCKKYFDEHIDSLLSIADGPCIVHRDYRPANIIATDSKIQGIIDWSSARSGFAQEDFCAMEHTQWTKNYSSKQPFLDGYESVRPLPKYKTILPLLRLSKSIATIGFISKRNLFEIHKDLYTFNLTYLEDLVNYK